MKSMNGYRTILPLFLAIFAGSANAAPVNNCAVTPEYTIVAEGQTVILSAACDAALTTANWKLNDGVVTDTVTGDVELNQSTISPVMFTTPVTGSGTFRFTMTGANAETPDGVISNEAMVEVMPANVLAAMSGEKDSQAPTSPVNGQCGTANGQAVDGMPSGTAQCAKGKPALAITNSDSYSWTCNSLNSGSDASCYAIRGFTVYASAGANGQVAPASVPVNAGGTATFTATPNPNYSATFSSPNCPGTQTAGSNNTTIYTTGPVNNSTCAVTVSFANAPVAGQCGSVSASITAPTASCSTGTPSAVTGATTTWNWTCAGTNGGATSGTCSATRQYTVSVGSISGGSVSFGSSTSVNGGQSLAFTATPTTAGQVPAFGGDCGVTQTANGYQTSARTSNCSMTVTFAAASVSGCGATPGDTTIYPASGSLVFPFNSPGLTVDSKNSSTRAYQFVNNLSSRTSGRIFMERGNQGGGAKTISVSECPGNFAVSSTCIINQAETGTINWTPGGTTIASGRLLIPSCKIEAGKTYYMNVKPSTAGQTVGYILGNI